MGQVLLGKYRVEEILGQGGMGVVARCTHLALNEQVAIKMLRKDVLLDSDAVERFMREAQAAVKLRSEYVARVSDVGTFEDGVPYMVMEFLDGHDLGALLEEQGHVAVAWAVELMLQAAEALAEAHSIGIVHRDVKPTNLFVTWRPDGTALIKVLDFGISKAPMGTDMQLTQTQSLLGTPAYMSPEQMRSARLVDARSDIWSLGTVMYELLEGRRPFEAESFSEMCVKVAVDPPAPMVNTPPGLQQVVLKCLAKSPEQRYASMADLGRDLVPFSRDQHGAQMLVERMVRMLGRRSSVDWGEPSTGSGRPALRSATPAAGVPRVVTPAAGIPRTPVPGAWTTEPGTAPAEVTHREPSVPALMPSETNLRLSRSRLPMIIAAFVALAIGVGAMLALQATGGDKAAEAAKTPAAEQPPDVTETPPPVGSADTSAATAGAGSATPQDSADDTTAPAIAPVATTSAKEEPKDVQEPKIELKPERTKKTGRVIKRAKPVKPPPKEPVKEVKPPDPVKTKVDPFATPRPTTRPNR